MRKLPFYIVAAVVLSLSPSAHGDKPAPKDKPVPQGPESKNYTVVTKLTRKIEVNDNGKFVLATSSSSIPNVTTLAATRGEYHTGGKFGETPYGFHLEVEVQPDTGDRIRLELSVEDSAIQNTTTAHVQTHRMRVVRHVRLGRPFTLELHSNDKGEGIWVELAVRVAAE